MLIIFFFYIGAPVAPAPPREPMSEAEIHAQWNDLLQYIKDETERAPATVTPSVNLQPTPTSSEAEMDARWNDLLQYMKDESERAPVTVIPSVNFQPAPTSSEAEMNARL